MLAHRGAGQRGIHPRSVQERLGHANLGITLATYSHVNPPMQAAAADLIAGLIAQAGDRT